MTRETTIPAGSLCECADPACPECHTPCNRDAVILVFDGPRDNSGTALCEPCMNGEEA